MVPYISESSDFLWTIPQKMSNTGYFDPIDDRNQELFWENKAVEANEVAEAVEVNETTVVSKAWKITIEDFSDVLVLELNNIWDEFR